MATHQQKLVRAANILAKYYGIPNTKDVAGAIALSQIATYEEGKWKDLTSPSDLDLLLNSLFIDSSEGAYRTFNLIQKLNDIIEGDSELMEALHKRFQIFFNEVDLVKGTKLDSDDRVTRRLSVNKMLGYAEGQEKDNTRINLNSANPSKENPSVSIILSNSTRISLAHRHIVPTTIFLNGIPNTEINRAVPYVNIEFFFAKPPVDNVTGKIQSLSLAKFLAGSQKISDEDSALNLLASAGQTDAANIASTQEPPSDVYSTAGMELFTSPQTLVNADEVYSSELRSTPVLDKFRPLMTLKSLEVSVRPTSGLMSYKSATLSFVLHDRSRLADIAEFVRADLYGTNEILIEYGWSHPDKNNDKNPYGMLIDAMRVKEKYGVINSSFTFDEAGQANITLNLAMRGGTELDTELISSDKDSLGEVLGEIQKLQEEVAKYKKLVFKNTDSVALKDIQGSQILNAAQDALSHVTFNAELQEAIRSFRKQFKKTKGGKYNVPDAGELIKTIKKLFGTGKKRPEKNVAVAKLRRTIAKSIAKKIKNLEKLDPFLLPRHRSGKGGRNVADTKFQIRKQERAYRNLKDVDTKQSVSLAKLLLAFLAEPLANSGKFDDIQLVFYPFNSYAGKASGDNLANFSVDLSFFVKIYHDYRLKHMSKSGNISVNEFLTLIADEIIDDPAAASYGLVDKEGAFHKTILEDKEIKGTKIVGSIPDYQERIHKILEKTTPGGEFRLPQVEFYLEAVPEKPLPNDNEDASQTNGRTILRIHVFDRLASSYETLGSLMASARDTEIQTLGKAIQMNNKDGNLGVQESKDQIFAATISAIKNSNLIEPIENINPPIYRIIGSSVALKDFMMKTMPYVIFGAAGTTIDAANLSTLQDSALSTVNLLHSSERTEIEPNGENPGGLPLRIIPTELNAVAKGCPLINFAQEFFVDFQTGTTADAIYSVVGMVHKFEPGSYKTDIKCAPLDGWGKYINLVQQVNNIAKVLEDIENRKKQA